MTIIDPTHSPPSRRAGSRRPFVVSGGGSGAPVAPAMWQQWAIGFGLGKTYDALIGPRIREAVNKASGTRDSPTFRPPLTPGWMIRDAIQSITNLFVGGAAFRTTMRLIGAPSNANPLIQAAGGAGIAGAAGANAGLALLATTAVGTLVGTLLDATYARTMGRAVEEPINRAFGIHTKTAITDTRGNVPLSAVKQTFEEASRQVARNFVGGITQGVVWNAFGSGVARAIAMQLAGPWGAIAGALGGMVLTSVISHGLLSAIGDPTANAAHEGVRLLKRTLGLQLDPTSTRKDIDRAIGDRITGDISSIVLPAATAGLTGQMGAFVGGLAPVRR